MGESSGSPDGTSKGGIAPPEFNGAYAREATIEDAPAIMRVLEAAFPDWPPYRIDVPALEHLRWKMETADGQPVSPHDVVIEDGQVVASMLAWVGYGKIGDATFVTDRAVDLAVHPDHQGKRFARLIVEPSDARNEDREDYFGFDTRSHAEPVIHMYDTDEGKVVRGISNWRLDFGRARRASALRHSPARQALVRRVLDRRHRALGAAADRVAVEAVSSLDERADRLWDRAHGQFEVVRRRDTRTLNWRYLDPRSGPHVVLAATESDRLLAYLAYRQPADGKALLLDVLAEPGRHEAVVALLRAMRRRLLDVGATQLRGWLMPGHPYEPAFEAAGLYRNGTFANVEFSTKRLRISAAAVEVISQPATSMHVTMGDFDWV